MLYTTNQRKLLWQADSAQVIVLDNRASRLFTKALETIRTTKNIAESGCQLFRAEEIHQQAVLTVTDHLLNRGSA